LNGGGSYIRLDACGIEAGTPGEYNVKAGYYGRKPKAKLTPELMAFPVIEGGDYSRCFKFFDDENIPYRNVKYIANFIDGTKKEGVTDDEG
ncbi:type VI secretion system tip protein VgrG, partial [Escherichia coli]|nr:type VI secretion system tip protein VgrG [Escherichia coli]